MEDPKFGAKLGEEIIHHTALHFTLVPLLELLKEEIKKRWRQYIGGSVISGLSYWLAHHWGVIGPWLIVIALLAFALVLFIWDMATVAKKSTGVTDAELTIFDLRKQVHEKDETINTLRENTPVIAWDAVFKMQRMKADPIATDPRIGYPNKLRMILTNISNATIYVWLPLWDSSIVPSQTDPTGARILLERSLGSWERQEWDQWKDKWVEPPVMKNIEYSCAKVRPGFTFECYVGLKPHATDSIAGLLARHSVIGTVGFPVKINGKIYEIRVPASEV